MMTTGICAHVVKGAYTGKEIEKNVYTSTPGAACPGRFFYGGHTRLDPASTPIKKCHAGQRPGILASLAPARIEPAHEGARK